jgi:Rps23 Pro-64 3,4-dihydroxylase Tpa1-like proline 4-hydroxylase
MLFEILDKRFDDATIDKLYGYFRDGKSWKFIGGVFNKKDSPYRKFQYDLDPLDEIDKIIFDESDKIIKEKVSNHKEFKVDNAYASGNVFGTINEVHQDNGARSAEEVITVMFYLNKIWNLSYGGETIFLSPNWSEIMFSVTPKPGRAIIFDGSIPHGAREISRTCAELRMVATVKYKNIIKFSKN